MSRTITIDETAIDTLAWQLQPNFYEASWGQKLAARSMAGHMLNTIYAAQHDEETASGADLEHEFAKLDQENTQ